MQEEVGRSERQAAAAAAADRVALKSKVVGKGTLLVQLENLINECVKTSSVFCRLKSDWCQEWRSINTRSPGWRRLVVRQRVDPW